MRVGCGLPRGEGRAGLRSVKREAAVGDPACVSDGSKEAGRGPLVPL